MPTQLYGVSIPFCQVPTQLDPTLPCCTQVAAYCSILDKDLRDRKKTSEVDISELLAASYASMFAAETGRRLKAVPTAFYRTPPERLFEGPAVAADWPGWVL